MSRLHLALLAAVSLLASTAHAALEWTTDLPAALEQAKKEKKMVLMDFTGSDWCGWCIKLKKDVFNTADFEAYAKKNLVLVEVDFPSKKKQSPELKKANDALKTKYGANGFPTIVVLNSEGKQVWKQVGYMQGGPTAWIAKLDEAKKK
ncbi:MAG: Thiol-disulfide isomerase or thioredoxin [Verrucomicrobiota bacterium]